MKKLNTLNKEELLIVLEKNSKLKEKVYDDMYNNADHWNSEYLACWNNKGIDYCIGYSRGAYFQCTDEEMFLDGLKKAQRDYCFLADEYNKTIESAEELMNQMDNLDYESNDYDEKYEQLEEKLTELINELEHECYTRFMSEYEDCFNNDYMEEYFIDFYVDVRMDMEDKDFYVDDDYVLYEHIEYEKSYQ